MSKEKLIIYGINSNEVFSDEKFWSKYYEDILLPILKEASYFASFMENESIPNSKTYIDLPEHPYKSSTHRSNWLNHSYKLFTEGVFKKFFLDLEEEVIAKKFDLYFTLDLFRSSVSAIYGNGTQIIFDPAGTDPASTSIFLKQESPINTFVKYVQPRTGKAQDINLNGKTGTVLQIKEGILTNHLEGVFLNLLYWGIPRYIKNLEIELKDKSKLGVLYIVQDVYQLIDDSKEIKIIRSNGIELIETNAGSIIIKRFPEYLLEEFLIKQQTCNDIPIPTSLKGLFIVNSDFVKASQPIHVAKFVSAESSQYGFNHEWNVTVFFKTMIQREKAGIITIIEQPSGAENSNI